MSTATEKNYEVAFKEWHSFMTTAMNTLQLSSLTTRSVREFVKKEPRTPSKREPEDDREAVAFLHQEVERGFPFVCGQAAVALWGQLEAYIEDFIATVIDFEPKLPAVALEKVQVKLGEYHGADEEGRLRIVVRSLQQNAGGEGANVFENVLKKLSLDGPVESGIGARLYELGHIRNVLVHRAAVADERLVEACPQLNLRKGETVRVSNHHLAAFGSAVLGYGATVCLRYLKKKGADERRIDKVKFVHKNAVTLAARRAGMEP